MGRPVEGQAKAGWSRGKSSAAVGRHDFTPSIVGKWVSGPAHSGRLRPPKHRRPSDAQNLGDYFYTLTAVDRLNRPLGLIVGCPATQHCHPTIVLATMPKSPETKDRISNPKAYSARSREGYENEISVSQTSTRAREADVRPGRSCQTLTLILQRTTRRWW
jgi:hypothetical protein